MWNYSVSIQQVWTLEDYIVLFIVKKVASEILSFVFVIQTD